MNVMIKRVSKINDSKLTTYILSGGYEVDVYSNGMFTVYTKTGNYAKSKTRPLVAKAIFAYENRQQG